jgi:hypothetical protein
VHGDEVVQEKRGKRRLKKKLQRWERPGRKWRDWPTIVLDGDVSQMPYAPVRSDRKLVVAVVQEVNGAVITDII